jgi:hypothetical protein
MDLLLENAGLVAFGLAAGKCWTCCWMDLCPERWKVLDLLLLDLLLESAGLVAGWTCVQNAGKCWTCCFRTCCWKVLDLLLDGLVSRTLESAGLVAFGLAVGKCWTCCWMDLCLERISVHGHEEYSASRNALTKPLVDNVEF